MTTIEARWLARGIGLPEVWKSSNGREWLRPHHNRSLKARIDLNVPQTAFGVALKLDAWTCAAPGFKQVSRHLKQLAECYVAGKWAYGAEGYLKAMAARATHIGMSHHIRRKLKWWDGPEPGTLATLEPWPKGGWVFTGDRFSAWFYEDQAAALCADTVIVPALSGITDPTEALRAIAEAL